MFAPPDSGRRGALRGGVELGHLGYRGQAVGGGVHQIVDPGHDIHRVGRSYPICGLSQIVRIWGVGHRIATVIQHEEAMDAGSNRLGHRAIEMIVEQGACDRPAKSGVGFGVGGVVHRLE